ncbi:MAG: hypothetical protein WA824_07440, partial [Candidatus Sulfotelmatobacter sp.]
MRAAFAGSLFAALLAAVMGMLAPGCAAQSQPTGAQSTGANSVENDPEPPRQQAQPSQPRQPNQKQREQPQQNQAQPPAVQPGESSSKQAGQEDSGEPTVPSKPAQPNPAQPGVPNGSSQTQNPTGSSSSKQSAPIHVPRPLQNEGNQIPITLQSSETIFSVLTAVNMCGYDKDVAISDPIRSRVRAEVQRNLAQSGEARAAQAEVCDFYQRHTVSNDQNRNLSPYISLALYLDGPPHFMPRTAEEDLPPDANAVAAFGTVLEHFYDKAGLHGIWLHHRNDYAAAMQRYHAPLAKMVFDTEIYLKEPSSEYLGRTFTVYVDFMGSPNETDARNYGTAYY